MLKTFRKGILTAAAAVLGAALLGGCGSGTRASDGLVHLNFQIWDNAQRGGMEAVARAYMDKNPEVEIQVQVTSWDEYWTKLDAAAESGQLPDIFWMHTNQILKYADYGKLEDVTDLYDDVEPDYYTSHFSDISLANARGSDGRMYGVPKDKDTVCLVYNKEMFDAAGVAYPDESWTWDDLTSASAQIYERTGKYGYMAYADEQLGYWNFVYQAGGYILNEDKTRAGFLDSGTRKAMEFYIGLQKEPWCPDQNYFAETAPGNAFMSEQGAMYLEGNWNLSYSTGAKGKKLEYARDFLKFAGSEEGQRVQGLSGAAIPAYKGLEDTWISAFDQYDYKLDVQKCVDMFPYGVQSVNNASRPNWKTQINDLLLKIYSGELSLDQGLEDMQKLVDEAKAP